MTPFSHRRVVPLLLAPSLLLPAGPLRADVLQEREQRSHPVWSPGGMVAVQEPRAAAAGVELLRQGGNAVDAAIGTAFALAVTHPQAGNLGGGGFLVLWLPGKSPARARGCLPVSGASGRGAGPELAIGQGTAVAVNFRETAPAAARPDLFVGPDGTVDRQLATRSLLSTAVPGSVAGLVLAQRCYGRLPLQRVIAPAIALAEQGFPVSRSLAEDLRRARPRLEADPTPRALFLTADRPGAVLRQPQLATTLRRIAAEGDRGFYAGPTAAALVGLMRREGGLITQSDLEGYRAQLVRPLAGRFRGATVLVPPPPSSAITILQLLAVLEPMPLASLGANGAESLHRMAEAMNLAYRDRNALLGDPDQVAIPLARMLAPAYVAAMRSALDLERHRPPDQVQQERPPLPESEDTIHLSTADRQGGMVALTTTLNFPFGNGIAVPGAGFLLNNEMDDFTAQLGSPNAFGLVQGATNAIAPGRRPLSSMSPTLVFHADGRPWFATGSPGGSRILTTVLQVLLNRIEHGLNLAGAVAAPRIHAQLLPDRFFFEEGLSPDTRRLLEAKGHQLVRSPAMGAANSVEITADGTLGVVDPRKAEGLAAGE
ncbi:gamma-glutamyltransferase [Cyanobium sp. NIES-981]|uniref:gamma-glutamyltransferase n=1 Tax=Cyanobium sp. NIES-981 TaxID=1851505 RepID=UPI0007DD359C|nr:gamma-glutamyltransferase [Cyanobium sp. NIES-981]SBO41752.1 Gamma-glutamyltranspeptidase [Cyanobium sp. NIES-981]